MAPFIAALIKAGLPALAGAIAKQGKDWVEDKIGIDLPALDTPALTPEQQAQLRIAEVRNRDVLIEAAKEVAVAELADTANARALQTSTLQAKSGWLSENFIYILTSFWSFVTCAYLAAVTFWTIPEGNQRFADTILGFILGTAISSIFGYFYGTTRSSNAKDGVVSRLLDRLSSKE